MAEESLTVKTSSDFLDEQRIPLRLACLTTSGWPIVLSLWFTRIDSRLWCATQETAKVIDYLRADPRCAFEVAPETPPYRGVRARADALLHKDRGEEILRILLGRYQGGVDTPLARRLLARTDTEVAIEIVPHTLHTWDYSARMRRQPGGELP